MRISKAVPLVLLAIGLSSCSYRRDDADAAERREAERRAQRDADSAGNKVGRGAYKAAEKTGEVVKKAGHELGIVGREIHDGWKDASRESKDKRERDR